MDDCLTAISDAANDNAALMPVLIGAGALVVVGVVLAIVSKRRRGAGAALMLLGGLALAGATVGAPTPAYAVTPTSDCPTGSSSAAPDGELVADVTQIRHAYERYITAPTKVQMTSDAGWAEDHPLEEVQQKCQGAYAPPAPVNVVLVNPADGTIAWTAPIDVAEDRLTLAGVPDGQFTLGLVAGAPEVGTPAPDGFSNAASLHWAYAFTDCVDMVADFGPDLTRGEAVGGYDGVLRVTADADSTSITVDADAPQHQLSFTLRAE